MFQHQGAILRGFIKKKDYKYNMYLGASGTWHFYVFYGDTEAHVWGVADKSLAPPERKLQQPNSGCIQHTPPKLSTLLSPLFQLLPATQKKIRILSVQTSPRQQWPSRGTKNGDLSIIFPVQGSVGSPTGPNSENRVGDQDIGSPGRPVSSGLPGEPGNCAKTRPPLLNLPRRFSFKISFNCTSRDE